MKKVFATLTVLAMLTIGSVAVMAQEAAAAAAPVAEETTETVVEEAPAVVEEVAQEAEGGIVALHKTLKTKFIEGGAGFMAATLLVYLWTAYSWKPTRPIWHPFHTAENATRVGG